MKPSSPTKDVLVLGQGVAGSLLTYELLERGITVSIADDDHSSSSSVVSAGLINPVTGKRFAILPDFDRYFEQAKSKYTELTRILGETFFDALPMIRIFQNPDERDHWMRKVEQGIGQEYCQANTPPNFHQGAVQDPLGSVVLRGTGFVRARRLLERLRKYFRERDVLIHQSIHYDELDVKPDGVMYQDVLYRRVVFCEGYRMQWNPWFDWVSFNSVKGEILRVAIDGKTLPQAILNGGKWCAPQNDGTWRAGSTYLWDELDCTPTPNGKDIIVEGLSKFLDNPVTVLDHQAGVRPVIDDQRVVLGTHPRFQSLWVFNGLGSRGFLIAPYFAARLAESLQRGEPLPEKFDVQRFKHKW